MWLLLSVLIGLDLILLKQNMFRNSMGSNKFVHWTEKPCRLLYFVAQEASNRMPQKLDVSFVAQSCSTQRPPGHPSPHSTGFSQLRPCTVIFLTSIFRRKHQENVSSRGWDDLTLIHKAPGKWHCWG